MKPLCRNFSLCVIVCLHGDADQGLLYHWVKYVKKSVSIVLKGRRGEVVENWSTNVNRNKTGIVHLKMMLLLLMLTLMQQVA